mgnify:CR=1 FL=1
MKLTVEEAARRMGVTPMFLRLGLREGKFPFGTAVKFDKRWSYHINPNRFNLWMEGTDLLAKDDEEGQHE